MSFMQTTAAEKEVVTVTGETNALMRSWLHLSAYVMENQPKIRPRLFSWNMNSINYLTLPYWVRDCEFTKDDTIAACGPKVRRHRYDYDV